jgi:hypothetical protein
MRLLRKRPVLAEVEIHLDDLLEPYSSDRVPAAEHQGIGAVRCARCSKPIVFAMRSGPGDCPWCEYELRIDLEREDRLSRRGEMRRVRRR